MKVLCQLAHKFDDLVPKGGAGLLSSRLSVNTGGECDEGVLWCLAVASGKALGRPICACQWEAGLQDL